MFMLGPMGPLWAQVARLPLIGEGLATAPGSEQLAPKPYKGQNQMPGLLQAPNNVQMGH